MPDFLYFLIFFFVYVQISQSAPNIDHAKMPTGRISKRANLLYDFKP